MNRARSPLTEKQKAGLATALVGLLTALVLVVTAGNQIYDTNYSALWEATALLAGDHPYRDFFEWGAPLTGVLSVLGQILAGYRLIGEFALQWLCITAGAVLSFHLSLRLSGSVPASSVTGLLALIVLATTPTYNYPKLLIYPCALILAYRYLDRPSRSRAALLGLVTTIGFLLRHDHGVHVAFVAALAFVIARLGPLSSRSVRGLLVEGATYAATAGVLLAPWLIVVQLNEGLPEYLRQRTALHDNWSVQASPFRSLVTLDSWKSVLFEAEPAAIWLQQITLLVPILVLASGVIDVVGRWYQDQSVRAGTWYSLLAAAFLVFIDDQIMRQPSYFVVVAPLTAAVATPLLVWNSSRFGATWKGVRIALGIGTVIVTASAGLTYQRLDPMDLIRKIRPTFVRLLASPPIEGILPAAEMTSLTRERWDGGEVDKESLMLRYLHDCTTAGDRVLVTGSTPSEVNYLIERPFAGGHILWHHGWRSDPIQEMRSLEQIQRQSVPFAYSNTDPVLEDLKGYPRIRAYFVEHYAALEGSDGLLLVDIRRTPVGQFGRLGFPCFR